MTTHYEDRCTVDGCPEPNSDDFHRCPVCGKQAVQHHHYPSRAQAGKGAKIVAALCQYHHDKITLHEWREGVYTHPDGSKRYYVQNQKGEEQCERIIEAAPEGQVSKPLEQAVDDGQRVVEAAPEGEPVEPRETLLAVKEPALPAVQYHATGLQLPEDLTREQWEVVANTIQQMIISAPWWIGDVLVYGQRYGEEMWQAIKERGGADYERLRKYMWVSERVPFGTRVPALKWSHHREVADLEPDEQKAWLQRAQDERLAVNELRLAIKGPEPPDVCPDSATGKHDYRPVCRHCGKEK